MTKAEAFLKQARADLAYFDTIADATDARIVDCHRLQALQMAVEKLAKAVPGFRPRAKTRVGEYANPWHPLPER